LAEPGSNYSVSALNFSNTSGLTFQWQSNTNNAGWVNEGPGTTAYFTFTGVAPENVNDIADWRLVTTYVATGDTSISTIATFTSKLIYCLPVYDYGCGYGSKINNVSTENAPINISNLNTDCSTVAPGYSDYTMDTLGVIPGDTFKLKITLSNSSSNVKAWIDFNQNGLFDVEELIAASTDRIANGDSLVVLFQCLPICQLVLH